METVFDVCQPRDDVLAGRVRDEEFAADLGAVISGTAPREYNDAATFFRHTHPTRGLRKLLETACRRLSGSGGELNSVIRLDTQFGGGKTHGLIALVHAARGMQEVESPSEFIDPAWLPKSSVRIAALDGQIADPANGIELESGLRAKTLWGEMAYRLAGRSGFERVRESDLKHVAPGASTIVELFGSEPSLILIDEVAVYLRKVAASEPRAAGQFAAFLQSLIKAVSETPRAALVCTLAIRSQTQDAADAYREEQRIAFQAFEEAESIVARKLLPLDPTEEDETVDVLRRRLFKSVDAERARTVVRTYCELWDRNRESLPEIGPETRDQFAKGYPLHPETLALLTRKVSSLQQFQRTRGMLRLLARTVHHLWRVRPADAHAIHPHHIDPGNNPIRDELTTRLGQQAYVTALKSDVAAVPNEPPSIAQQIDAHSFAGQPPVASYVARTVFLNTLAFGDAAQGISTEALRYSVCSPAIEPSFVEAARKEFIADSLYLDDRPGAPMRFRIEPNLTQVISRSMRDVDADEVRGELNAKIRDLFTVKSGSFQLLPFPAGPHEIPDEIGDGRPYLVVLNYDAFCMSDGNPSLSPDLVRMATRKGVREEFRTLLNNVVFLVADDRLAREMKTAACRRLALQAITAAERFADLPDYQQRKVREELEKSRTTLAIAILQCYRHLFYPRQSSDEAKLGHATIELQNASDSPGNGQLHLKRALREQHKLLEPGDAPDDPNFVRDQTPLRTKGCMSTADLRGEYRRAPDLSIVLDDKPLIDCIRLGIERGRFVYREGSLLCGKGDPMAAIHVSDSAFVHTIEDAARVKIWPRPAPEAQPQPVAPTTPPSGPTPSTSTGGAGPATTPPVSSTADRFQREGPLRQALTELFDSVRRAKVSHLAELSIRCFEAKGAWSVQTALAGQREVEVECSFTASTLDDDASTLDVKFKGSLSKATNVKSMIERPLQAARTANFDGTYRIQFKKALSTDPPSTDAWVSALTKYGGSEAYVEAVAAPQQGARP